MLVNLKKILTLLLCSLILTACVHHQAIIQKIHPNQSCLNQCLQEFSYCKKICTDSCPECCGVSKFHALESYHRYVRQSHVQGFFPINLLQSYDDPLKCKKNSCECQADYVLCKQHCTGIITKKLNHKKQC
jgi:hypothetical protein